MEEQKWIVPFLPKKRWKCKRHNVEVYGEKCPLCEHEKIHIGVNVYAPKNKRSRKAP